MTDIDVYQPAGQIEQYQGRMVMTPEAAKALDDQLTQCIRAILHEGTDYGVIPGTGGDKSLWRPGAQKLLLWFGLGFTCDPVDIERDDDGRKLGVTYRATVTRRLPDGTLDVKATCEGYAGFDEDKFYQSAEQMQDKAEARERMWAKKDGRVANPTKWKGDPDRGIPAPGEYRAPWNSVIKRAQKRAIVGATLDATAAGGRFNQDREEDDHTPPPQDDGPSWYERAIELALASTETEPGGELQALFTGAAQAHKDGLISRRQQDHVQNTVRQRLALLKKAAVVVDAEDLATQAARLVSGGVSVKPDPTRPAAPAATATATGSSTAPAADGPSDPAGPGIEMPENDPGSAGKDQLTKLHAQFTKLGFGSDERDQKLAVAEAITGRKPLTGPHEGRSSKNLSWAEAAKLTLALAVMDSRDDLIAWMSEHQQEASYE